MAPPHVVASIDGMVVYGDCDGGTDNPGDFFFSVEIDEVIYPEPGSGRADPPGAGGVSPAESPEPDYVLLDQIERVLVQAESSPDPVRLPRLEASTPFDETEFIALRVTLSVYENDGAGPQWTAEEERPMSWHPGEQCWMQYGDLGCVARERGDLIWTGALDYGSQGSACDVEIDWSITYE